MKAMILAAGLGVRMRPLTDALAKPALPLLNVPLIGWTLRSLKRAGVVDVLVNTHYQPESLRRAVAQARPRGLRISWSHEPVILGTGGGPRAALRFFGDAPALLVNGDAWFDFDLRALFRRHVGSGALATLALRPNPDPDVYGPVVTGPRGRIRSLAGRPAPAAGAVSMFTGVHVIEPRILERLPSGASDSVRDLYAPLVAEGALLQGIRVGGAWYDLGGPSTYLASQLAILRRIRSRSGTLVDPRARVAPGARLARAIVGARSRIASGARVSGSVLWDGVVVEPGASVEGCVLATGVTVSAGERIVGEVVTSTQRRAL